MRFTRFAFTLGCVASLIAGCDDDDQYGYLAAEAGFALQCFANDDTVHLRLSIDPDFIDNSYGRTSIGWGEPRRRPWVVDAVYPDAVYPEPRVEPGPPLEPGPHGPPPPPHKMGPGRGRGPKMMPPPPAAPHEPPHPEPHRHTLDDLVASDSAEFVVTNVDHEVVSRFRIDYISRVRNGYASLGVLGGDGDMIIGDPEDIVAWSTSLERNLNELGYAEYVAESPDTDARYSPSVLAPDWEFAVVYDVWLDARIFDWRGFGDAYVASVHASPSKVRANAFGPLPRHCL